MHSERRMFLEGCAGIAWCIRVWITEGVRAQFYRRSAKNIFVDLVCGNNEVGPALMHVVSLTNLTQTFPITEANDEFASHIRLHVYIIGKHHGALHN